MQLKYNTELPNCQGVHELLDLSKSGKPRDWRGKKICNILLAEAYESVNPDKASRLRECSTMLSFRRYADGTKKLDSVNSCRVRLCPICSWRRSLKCYHNTRSIMDYIDRDGGYGYVFLTLTIRNCRAEDLEESLRNIYRGWGRFTQLKRVKSSVKGWYRGLEITHDTDQYITRERYSSNPRYYRNRGLYIGDLNPNFDTYHPHIHCIFVVRKCYFNSRYYIAQHDYTEMWRRSLRLDYDPIVDVRKVNGDCARAVAEISKYAVKSVDYIVPDDWDLTVDTVRTLDVALANKRLYAYGGVMKTAHRVLNLDDSEDGDLVHICEKPEDDPDYEIVNYFWHNGYRQYISTDDYV